MCLSVCERGSCRLPPQDRKADAGEEGRKRRPVHAEAPPEEGGADGEPDGGPAGVRHRQAGAGEAGGEAGAERPAAVCHPSPRHIPVTKQFVWVFPDKLISVAKPESDAWQHLLSFRILC